MTASIAELTFRGYAWLSSSAQTSSSPMDSSLSECLLVVHRDILRATLWAEQSLGDSIWDVHAAAEPGRNEANRRRTESPVAGRQRYEVRYEAKKTGE